METETSGGGRREARGVNGRRDRAERDSGAVGASRDLSEGGSGCPTDRAPQEGVGLTGGRGGAGERGGALCRAALHF